MSTDTCRRIQVARPGYMLTVSRRRNKYSFMSRSTCIPLYPATDGRQTGDNFVADTRNMQTATATSGYKWIQLVSGNIVSWFKRGISARDINTTVRATETISQCIARYTYCLYIYILFVYCVLQSWSLNHTHTTCSSAVAETPRDTLCACATIVSYTAADFFLAKNQTLRR